MKIGVIGVGYVGLVTAVCFAEKGYDVYVHDLAKEKIATLQSGGLPIYEEGLSSLFHKNRNKLYFTHDASVVISECEVLFICVGTPQDENGKADVSFVRAAAERIGRESTSNKTVIIKSTVPPGTTENMEQYTRKQSSSSVRIAFLHNPEFLRQGKATYDFMNPERIVLGSSHADAITLVKDLYRSWETPIIETDSISAELLKYTANSFLALKISFINMVSQLSDRLGSNIDDIAYGIGLDRRIGSDFLKPGIGFGGSCFPKDLSAVQHAAKELGVELPLLANTATINELQGRMFFERIKSYCESLKGKKIALLGLSFKPFTDDIRCSPALELSERLLREGATLYAYDPLVKKFPIDEVKVFSDIESSLYDADMVVIATDWPEFKGLMMLESLKKLKQPVIFDGRNMFSIEEIKNISLHTLIHYESIGRPTISNLHSYRRMTKNNVEVV